MEKKDIKKIVFLLAPNDFRDEEYFQPKVIIQSKGIEVHTAVKGDPEEVTGTRGGKARPDTEFASLKADDFAGLVLVGGNGSRAYFEDAFVHALVRDFIENDKVVGAICSATGILAYAGVLRGIKATGFEAEKDILIAQGADFTGSEIEVAGKIVTARDAEYALQFGSAIAKALM